MRVDCDENNWKHWQGGTPRKVLKQKVPFEAFWCILINHKNDSWRPKKRKSVKKLKTLMPEHDTYRIFIHISTTKWLHDKMALENVASDDQWQLRMTTSWHGNTSRITGPLWGNPPATVWFPPQRDRLVLSSVDASFFIQISLKFVPNGPINNKSVLIQIKAPSLYLNQHWLIVNWTISNKLQWNLNKQHTIIRTNDWLISWFTYAWFSIKELKVLNISPIRTVIPYDITSPKNDMINLP